MLPREVVRAAPSIPAISYLCFTLSREALSVEAARVCEIMAAQPLAAFPDPCPAYVSGGLYLRGKVIPILDLAPKLHLSASPASPGGYVMLFKTGPPDDRLTLGFLVARLTGVVQLPASRIRPLKEESPGVPHGLFVGTIKVKGRHRRLLNLSALLTPGELEQLRNLLR
jgi:purine-binding chemotaxis protein CheW